MSGARSHRLDGLEPDNLLAFLALLGLLRALRANDRERPGDSLNARAAWDCDTPPLRARIFLIKECTQEEIAERAAQGLLVLAGAHEFEGRPNLDYSRAECRMLLEHVAKDAHRDRRERIDLLAALMSDGAIKNDKEESIDATPLCVQFGQGHQYFLSRLANVPRESAPPPRGKGKKATAISATECIVEALFKPWHRKDPTSSFRWDPEEAARHALMPGDPTDALYKSGTQHGANRLASVGLAALTLVPQRRGRTARAAIIGGTFGSDGFSFAWPIWRPPATLSAIRALLTHPDLRKPGALTHLGVDHVLVTRRISVGKFMSFSRARPISAARE